MDRLNQLTSNHVNEYGDLLKKHQDEKRILYYQQLQEIKQHGPTPQITDRHAKEQNVLQNNHSQQIEQLTRKHDDEYKSFLADKALTKLTQQTLKIADQNEAQHLINQRKKADEENERIMNEGMDEYRSLKSKLLAKMQNVLGIKKTTEQDNSRQGKNKNTQTKTVTKQDTQAPTKDQKKAKLVEKMREQLHGKEKEVVRTEASNPPERKRSQQEKINGEMEQQMPSGINGNPDERNREQQRQDLIERMTKKHQFEENKQMTKVQSQ